MIFLIAVSVEDSSINKLYFDTLTRKQVEEEMAWMQDMGCQTTMLQAIPHEGGLTATH